MSDTGALDGSPFESENAESVNGKSITPSPTPSVASRMTGATPSAEASAAPWIWFSDREQTRWLTLLSVVGIIAGTALALNGRLSARHADAHPCHRLGGTHLRAHAGFHCADQGDLALAWRYNPTSFLVVGGAVTWIARSLAGLATHRWLNVRARLSPHFWAGLGVGVVLLEAVQQSNADFIITSRL